MSLIPQDRSKLSPMMQQYLSMKDEHRDQILMFRLGDFYEMFFDDAVTASRELELTLTGRDCVALRRSRRNMAQPFPFLFTLTV